jgi:exodeoxyribonuclease VII large subunit
VVFYVFRRSHLLPLFSLANCCGIVFASYSQNHSMERQRNFLDEIPSEPPPRRVLSVAQLTLSIKSTLETKFEDVWVSGEISEVTQPQSGHIYFALKDETAQVRAVLWKSAAARIKFKLKEGMQVICRGTVDVYPPRGTYSLVVRQIEPQGQGALQLAFKQLFERLTAEGLFDPARKRPLPRFPQRVGFVTSPTGAAVHDFLQVAGRRFPGVNILVIPARVQGEGSAAEIVRGIKLANQLRPALDVLVVGRGGGSLEDLWSFNEEAVVRAIHASQIPVVSAVGHEVDVTLADLVADVRALTPSEAAERVIPAADDLRQAVLSAGLRMTAAVKKKLARCRTEVEQLAQRRVLRKPFDQLRDLNRAVDELQTRLAKAWQRWLVRQQDRLTTLAARLEGLSPLSVLRRGYSVTMRQADQKTVLSAEQLQPGDELITQLSVGKVISQVKEIL